MKRIAIAILLVPVIALAGTLVNITATGGGRFTCYVDDVAVSNHSQEYKAAEQAADLKLQNPDSVVSCTQNKTIRAELTGAGFEFVSRANAGVIIVEPPPVAGADTFHFSQSGSDTTGDGSLGNPYRSTTLANTLTLTPGDTLLFERGGDYTDAPLLIDDSGQNGSRITVDAYGAGDRPLFATAIVTGDYVTWNNIHLDNQFLDDTRGLQWRGENGIADGFLIERMAADCLEMETTGTSNPSLTVRNYEIRHCLRGSYGTADDAHGIVIRGDSNTTYMLTSENGTIHEVSGDSVQIDPNRDSDPDGGFAVSNVTFVYNSTGDTYYTQPLASSLIPGSWDAGDIPGEDGIDAKCNEAANCSLTFNVTDFTGYGWVSVPEYSNRTPFNIKENADVVINRATLYDNERCFRLRNDVTDGNPRIRIQNTVAWNCDTWMRIESGVDDLQVYNNTVGLGVNTSVNEVDGGFGSQPDARNNLFLGALPTEGTGPGEFSGPTNIAISSAQFVDSGNNDYRLCDTVTAAIGQGEVTGFVATDRDGVTRNSPPNIGAYTGSDSGCSGGGGPDTTPDAFNFTALGSQSLSTLVTSNTITPTGFDTPIAVSVDVGECQVDTGAFSANCGTLSPGGTVTVRHTTASGNSQSVVSTVTVGNTVGTFTSTTEAAQGGGSNPGNSYYNLLVTQPESHGWADLRSAAQRNAYLFGNPSNSKFDETQYDATEDAMRFETLGGTDGWSIEIGEQIHVGGRTAWQNGPVAQSSANNLLWYWEAKAPAAWVSSSPPTYKAFMMNNPDNDLVFEPRWRFSLAQSGQVAKLDVRIYGNNCSGPGTCIPGPADSIANTNDNVNIPPDEWVRYWMYFDFQNDVLSYWVSYAGQAPVAVLDQEILNWDAVYGTGRVWSRFQCGRFNSSEDSPAPAGQPLFCRNVWIGKDLANHARAVSLVGQGSLQ
ncbi:MAG: hypothetical protein AAFX44_06570 [Pseudomonadota bacterium]